MKHYFFGHKIRPKGKAIERLVSFVNRTDGNLTIGLSSTGGEVGASLFILDMLNDNKDRIHLVASGIVYSAAFDIWLGFKGYKSANSGSMGMTHQVDTTVRVSEKGYYMLEDVETIKNQMSFAEIAEETVFPILTAKQKTAYEEGKDVYIACEELRKIATKHNRTHKAKKLV